MKQIMHVNSVNSIDMDRSSMDLRLQHPEVGWPSIIKEFRGAGKPVRHSAIHQCKVEPGDWAYSKYIPPAERADLMVRKGCFIASERAWQIFRDHCSPRWRAAPTWLWDGYESWDTAYCLLPAAPHRRFDLAFSQAPDRVNLDISSVAILPQPITWSVTISNGLPTFGNGLLCDTDFVHVWMESGLIGGNVIDAFEVYAPRTMNLRIPVVLR